MDGRTVLAGTLDGLTARGKVDGVHCLIEKMLVNVGVLKLVKDGNVFKEGDVVELEEPSLFVRIYQAETKDGDIFHVKFIYNKRDNCADMSISYPDQKLIAEDLKSVTVEDRCYYFR